MLFRSLLDEQYIVDLITKELYGPGIYKNVTGSFPKLIYKRRNDVRVEVGTGKLIDPRVTHILGIQTSTNMIQFEVFHGLGMRPAKIEMHDLKKNLKNNITEKVNTKKRKIIAEKTRFSTIKNFRHRLKEIIKQQKSK